MRPYEKKNGPFVILPAVAPIVRACPPPPGVHKSQKVAEDSFAQNVTLCIKIMYDGDVCRKYVARLFPSLARFL